MKRKTLHLFLFILPAFSFSQSDSTGKRSLFLEIAGSGGFGSINYEKQFCKKKNTAFTWRAGFSIAPIDKNNGFGIVFPLMIHSITGKNAHKLELGIGQGITITTKGSFFAMGLASVGYRYQKEDKKWFYRITYTPLISYIVDFQVQQWAGISIGRSINSR